MQAYVSVAKEVVSMTMPSVKSRWNAFEGLLLTVIMPSPVSGKWRSQGGGGDGGANGGERGLGHLMQSSHGTSLIGQTDENLSSAC